VKGRIDTLAGAASLAQPELAPLAMGAAYLANDYIDNPDSYTHEKVKQKASDQLNQQMNDQFGTNYGNNLQATMNNLSQNSKLATIRAYKNIAAATNYISPIITAGLSGPESLNQVLSVPTPLPVQNTITRQPLSYGKGLYVNMGARADGLYPSMSGGDLTGPLLAAGAHTFPGHGLHAKRHRKVYEKGSVMAGGSLLFSTQSLNTQSYMEFNMQSNFVPASVRKFRTTVVNPFAK
jgi:hypothetical protein